MPVTFWLHSACGAMAVPAVRKGHVGSFDEFRSDLALALGPSVSHFEDDFFLALESEISLVRQRRPLPGGATAHRLRWPGSVNAA